MNEIQQFIANIDEPLKRSDTSKLLTILQQESGYNPILKGSVIGFGSYHYKYASGHEGDAPILSFAPRKNHLVIYITPGFERFDEHVKTLGKHKRGKSCLYIKKLEDINLNVLKNIARESVLYVQNTYTCTSS